MSKFSASSLFFSVLPKEFSYSIKSLDFLGNLGSTSLHRLKEQESEEYESHTKSVYLVFRLAEYIYHYDIIN